MPFRRGLRDLVLGSAIGAAEILVARYGVHERPAIGALVLIAGAVAGFLPLRISLPFVVLVGCNQGFLVYFVGGHARYWKEAFVVGLLLRALRRRGPSYVEVAALLGLVGVALGYLIRGSSTADVAWGFKLLVLFALGGWAIARLKPGHAEWAALFSGLAITVAAAVPFAIWQKSVGVGGLLQLGYPYGVTVRVADGSLRAFGGFLYGAPFAYALAVATLCWVAVALCGQRQHALATAWLPVFAAVGIALSLNRIALVASAAAITAALVRYRHLRLGIAATIVALVMVLAAVSSDRLAFLAQGFTFGSSSAEARTSIWSSKWAAIDTFGHGPSSAGAAFDKAHPRTEDVLPTNGASEAVVDNLYLSWLYQYGALIGAVFAAVWFIVLLRPLATSMRGTTPIEVAGELVGVFFVVAAFAVNVWEEFPLNLLLALIVGSAVSTRSQHLVAGRRGRVAERQVEPARPAMTMNFNPTRGAS